jgi:hypothetical protein
MAAGLRGRFGGSCRTGGAGGVSAEWGAAAVVVEEGNWARSVVGVSRKHPQ